MKTIHENHANDNSGLHAAAGRADHEDLTSPGYLLAWALFRFALGCMIVGAVVMKIIIETT